MSHVHQLGKDLSLRHPESCNKGILSPQAGVWMPAVAQHGTTTRQARLGMMHCSRLWPLRGPMSCLRWSGSCKHAHAAYMRTHAGRCPHHMSTGQTLHQHRMRRRLVPGLLKGLVLCLARAPSAERDRHSVTG